MGEGAAYHPQSLGGAQPSEPSDPIPANPWPCPSKPAGRILLLPPEEGRDEGRLRSSSPNGSWSQCVSKFWRTLLSMIAPPTSAVRSDILASQDTSASRMDYLDATRAFALLLGIVFHASLSFMPIFMAWAVQDVSTSPLVAAFVTVSHAFRMETFFLIAGLLGHRAFHRKGAVEFVRSRLLRIGVPFVAGWFLLRPLVVSGWILGSASLRGEVDVPAALWGGVASLATLPAGILTGTHLWFLYYLLWVTAALLVVRSCVLACGRYRDRWIRELDAGVGWLANSPWAPMSMALPIAAALGLMNSWGMDTPDHSLRPHLPVLAVYGGFFALGWMLDRRPESLVAYASPTAGRWVWAGLGTAVILWLGSVERDPGYDGFRLVHAAYAVGYAVATGALVSLTVGVFRTAFGRPRAWVRYLADASYWMYLVHLPIVVWLQVAVAELPFHWTLKLGFVSAATIAIALLVYDLFVRSTFLGALLNGRRRDRVLVPWLLGGPSKPGNGFSTIPE